MSAQKPEAWVNSLINRFEEQLPVKTGLKTAQSRSTLDLHKDCLVQVSRVKFVLVINGITRILQNINATRIIGEEAERTLFESQIIILDTLEECLSVYPLRDTTRVEEAKILSILLPEVCQFLLFAPPHPNDPLQSLLRASASYALYAMSRASFSVIFAKISSRLQVLVEGSTGGSSNAHYIECGSNSSVANDAGDFHSSAGDLELIQYIHVDRAVLTKLLNEFVSKLRHLRNKPQLPPSLVISLEKCIWNYVETYPADYMQHQKEPEEELADACEKLFDIFNETVEGSSKRKAQVWPLQMLLMLFSPKALEEIVNADNGAPISAKHLKKKLYIDAVRKALQGHSASSKQLHEGAVVSCVKLCKASTYIDTRDSTNVTFVLVQNVQAELKATLFNTVKPFSRGPALAQADIDLMVDAFVAFFHINPHNTDILKACLQSAAMSAHIGHSSSSPVIFHLALIQALHRIIVKPRLKFWPAIDVWYNKLGELRTLFIDTLNRVMNGYTGHHTALKFAHSFNIKDKVQTQFKQALKASADNSSKAIADDVVSHRALLSNIVKLIYADPTMFLHNASKAQVHDVISGLVSVVSQAFLPPDLSADCMEALLKLHQTRNIMLWNPESPVVTFWEISSSILFSICQNLLQHIIPNYTDVLLWLKQTLACRNIFLEQQNRDTGIAANTGSATPMARQAHIKLEAVLFSYLWSIDIEAILVAMASFGLMCDEAKIRAPDEYALQLMMPNHDTYMELAHASQGLATGRAQLQKRLLTVLCKIEVPTPGLQQSWDETYRCWEEALKFFNHYPKQGERPSRRRFTSMMLAHTSLDHELDDYFAEWQNMTGFLCALGGVCVQRRSPLHAPASLAVSSAHSAAGGGGSGAGSSSGSGLWTTTPAALNDAAMGGSSVSLTSSFITIDGPSGDGGGSLSNSNAPSPRTRAPLLGASMGNNSSANSSVAGGSISVGGTTTTTTTTFLPSSGSLLDPVHAIIESTVGSSSASSATRHYCPVTELLRHMLVQLTCQNEKFGAKVQKQIRDSLAHELHEALYPALFEQLRLTIDKFLDSPQSGGKVVINFANTAFVEHAISIIVGILVRSTPKSSTSGAVVVAPAAVAVAESGASASAGSVGRNVSDSGNPNLTPTAREPSALIAPASSTILITNANNILVDGNTINNKPSRLSSFPIDGVVLNIARYCRNLDSSGYSQHIKVRFCGLCEEIMSRREMLYFRSELRFRNRLLDCISDWVLGSTSHHRIAAALANANAATLAQPATAIGGGTNAGGMVSAVPAALLAAGGNSSVGVMPSLYPGMLYQQQLTPFSSQASGSGMMMLNTMPAGSGRSGDLASGASAGAANVTLGGMTASVIPISSALYNSSGMIVSPPNSVFSPGGLISSQSMAHNSSSNIYNQFYQQQQQQQPPGVSHHQFVMLPTGGAVMMPSTSSSVVSAGNAATQSSLPAAALELDLAAVRAIAHILHELPLQPGDNERGDIAEAKSQLFLKYFTLLMNILNECQQNLNLAALLAAATAQSNMINGYAVAAAAAANAAAAASGTVNGDGSFAAVDQQQQQLMFNYSVFQQQQGQLRSGVHPGSVISSSGMNYRQQMPTGYFPQQYYGSSPAAAAAAAAAASSQQQQMQMLQYHHQQQLQQQQKNAVLEKQTRAQQHAWEQLRAFSIQAMSNLLSANVEHGLVHAVPLGYHTDVQTRVAFIEVLTQILQQGTQFDTLAENAIAERKAQLVDLLVMQDERGQFPMARALADSVPSNNNDSATELARVLVSLFDARNLLMPLLASVFHSEVQSHDDYMTLFRGNNLATKIMSSCSNQFGSRYWFSLLAPHVQHFVANLSGNGGLPLTGDVFDSATQHQLLQPQADGMMEVGVGIGGVYGAGGGNGGAGDAAGTADGGVNPVEAATLNFRYLERASAGILEAVCTSAARMPEKLKLMFTIMHASIADRFAEPRPLSVVTTIMFLRYINPAIVSPKENGLLDRQPPLSVKHGLVNVSKIVQAAAGANEFPHEHPLKPFNPLVKRYAERIRAFCANITTWTPPPSKVSSSSAAMNEPLLLVDADDDDDDVESDVDDEVSAPQQRQIAGAETLQQQQPPLVSKLNSRQQHQQNAWKCSSVVVGGGTAAPTSSMSAAIIVQHQQKQHTQPYVTVSNSSSYVSEVDVIALHRLMWVAQDRIGDYLSANYRNHYHHPVHHHLNNSSNNSFTAMSAVSGRGPYDKLVTLLAYLGPPEQRSFDTWSPVFDSGNAGGAQFEEFWQKHRIQDREEFKCMKSLNVFYQAGKSTQGCPVFYYIARKYLIQQHHPDMLLYLVLMTIKPLQHMKFDLVIDLTHCCSENRFKTEVLQKWMCVLPREAIDNVNNIYIYNTSTWVKEYTKFHERVLAPVKNHRIIFCDSISKLSEYLSGPINLPVSTMQLEEDLKVYTDALKLSNKDMRCYIKLSPGAVQVQACERTKVLGHPVVLNDVYYASEIDEVILVDDNQFTLTIQQESGPLSFIHEQCEELVQGIIHIRTRWELSQPDHHHHHHHVQQHHSQQQYGVRMNAGCMPGVAAEFCPTGAAASSSASLYHPHQSSIKPKAVPGMLLNICLLNLGSGDALLRSAAYNLLCVLAETFHMKIEGQLLETGGLCIPANNTNFIKSVSEKLARQESSYTLDFLDEVINGFKSSPIELKHLILEYAPPWLLNLPQFLKSPSLLLVPTTTTTTTTTAAGEQVVNGTTTGAVVVGGSTASSAAAATEAAANAVPTVTTGNGGGLVMVESKRQKVTNIIDRFITLTLEDEDGIYAAIIAKVWGTLGQLPDMIDVVLDQFLKRSVTQGLGSPASELLADTTVALASASRDKLVSRKIVERTLRVLERTCVSPSWQFEQHLMFEDVGILLRYLLMLSFNNQIDVIDNFPYLLHVITMLMCCGTVAMRASVHGLAINTIHSLLTSSSCAAAASSATTTTTPQTFGDDTQRTLRLSLTEFSLPKFHGYFGLRHNIFSACKTTALNAFQSTDLFMRNGAAAAGGYDGGASAVVGGTILPGGGNSPTSGQPGAGMNDASNHHSSSSSAATAELNLVALETVCDAFLELVEACEKDANRQAATASTGDVCCAVLNTSSSNASLPGQQHNIDNAPTLADQTDNNNMLPLPHSPTITTTPTNIGAAAAAANCNSSSTTAIADVRQWHAQWLALAKSFAMRYNPALQPRALVVYGAIAKQASDRDVKTLLRLLVKALESFNHLALINALIMCMTRLQPLLQPDSPIHKALFWVAICVLELDEVSLYASGLALLEENLRTLDALGYFTQQPPISFDRMLMSTREPLEWQYFKQLDHASGMSFKANFHFALVGHLIKAYRHPSLDVRKRVVCILNMLLNIISKQQHVTLMTLNNEAAESTTSIPSSPFTVSKDTVPYLIALLPVSEEARVRCRLQYKPYSFSIQYVMAQTKLNDERKRQQQSNSAGSTGPTSQQRAMSTIQRPLANTRPYSVDLAEPRLSASAAVAAAGSSNSNTHLAGGTSANAAAFALNKARSSDFADYAGSNSTPAAAHSQQQQPVLPQYHRYPVAASSAPVVPPARQVVASRNDGSAAANPHVVAAAVLSGGGSGGARGSSSVTNSAGTIQSKQSGTLTANSAVAVRPNSQPPVDAGASAAARSTPGGALLSMQMLQIGGGASSSVAPESLSGNSSSGVAGMEVSAAANAVQSASSSPGGGDTLMPSGGGGIDTSSRKQSSSSSTVTSNIIGADSTTSSNNNNVVPATSRMTSNDNFLLDASILNDYQTQALTLSLLATLVRHTNDENEARVLYQYLAEGSAVFPKVFPIIHSLLDVKVNGVLQLCHDSVTLAAVQAIIQNMIIYDSQEHQGSSGGAASAAAAAAAASNNSSNAAASFPPPTMQCIGFGGLWRFAGPFNKAGSSADNSELFVNCLEAMVETCLPADDDDDEENGGAGGGGGGDFYVEHEMDSDYSRGTTYPVDSSAPHSPSTINSFEMQQQRGGAGGAADIFTHFN